VLLNERGEYWKCLRPSKEAQQELNRKMTKRMLKVGGDIERSASDLVGCLIPCLDLAVANLAHTKSISGQKIGQFIKA
jgi:hypothetical protein